MNFLIIGQCGVGKTWIMKQLISNTSGYKLGLICFHIKNNYLILGKYSNKTFSGSDALSMAVSKDFIKLKKFCDKNNYNIICEGDRFMNKKFINIFDPKILKIDGDGTVGRKKRNSQQSEQHLKRIKTRVANIKEHYKFKDSNECYLYIKNII